MGNILAKIRAAAAPMKPKNAAEGGQNGCGVKRSELISMVMFDVCVCLCVTVRRFVFVIYNKLLLAEKNSKFFRSGRMVHLATHKNSTD